MSASTYVTKLYDRLDKITYDRYGSTNDDLVLFVIEANPGIEKQPILLTPGLKINLPDAPVKTKSQESVRISLW